MKTIKSCEFNMDTGCVELRFQDGSMISIDCTAVENEVADNLYERSELDPKLPDIFINRRLNFSCVSFLGLI